MEENNNAMRRQALSLPELLRQQYKDLEPKTRKILSTPEIFSIQNIVLTGCGDSKFAAMATKHAFESLTGMRTEVVTAVELARYYPKKRLGNAPNNPLVIAVSNSGGVARVGEAVQRCVKNGAFVLGVTGKEESLLGQSCSRVLKLDIPKFDSAPGVRGYLVSVLVLQLLAIRIGEVRGKYTMDTANAMRKDLLKQADALEEALPRLDAQMAELAEKWQHMEAFDFLGAGPDEAAAAFGQAKVFEAAGKYAMCVNTEEFLHLNFFMRNVDKIGTVLVCHSQSPALSRAREVAVHCVNDLRRPTLVVTDDASVFDIPAENIALVPKSAYAITAPLTQFVPLALLMADIMNHLGEVSGRGCVDNWAFAKGGAGIKNSEIIVL